MSTAVVNGRVCSAPAGDSYVQCSFEPSHIILRSKMPNHLIKCKANHPGHNKIQCFYNASEYIDPTNLAQHIYECECRNFEFEKKRHEDLKANIVCYKTKSNLATVPHNNCTDSVGDREMEDNNINKDCLEKKSDVHNDNCLRLVRGIGRGNLLNKPTPKISGMGRAEFFKLICNPVNEQRQLVKATSQTNNCEGNIAKNQFDDV